ncbi:hypothetical protein DFH27DRAFT_555806 [Peziza echinospora]|nr:hypothetical protein DFH27DRAFT_555806 [Peziza echinospora]
MLQDPYAMPCHAMQEGGKKREWRFRSLGNREGWGYSSARGIYKYVYSERDLGGFGFLLLGLETGVLRFPRGRAIAMGVKYRSSPSGGILTTTSTTTFTLLLLLLLLLLPLATPASTSKTAFADGYCSSCSVNVWDPGSAEACGTKLLDAVNSCQSTYGAQKCYDAQRKIDQNYDYSMDGGKVCVAQGGCFHVCVDVGVNSYSTAQVQLCCLKPGSVGGSLCSLFSTDIDQEVFANRGTG